MSESFCFGKVYKGVCIDFSDALSFEAVFLQNMRPGYQQRTVTPGLPSEYLLKDESDQVISILLSKLKSTL